MSEALVNSQTPQQWCYRALTAEARMMELEAKAMANRVSVMRLEANLAKAVEALEGLMMHEPDYADTLWQDARTTLAELKG